MQRLMTGILYNPAPDVARRDSGADAMAAAFSGADLTEAARA